MQPNAFCALGGRFTFLPCGEADFSNASLIRRFTEA